MSKNDIDFFTQIREQAVFKKTMVLYGFQPEIYEPKNGVRNCGLKCEKRNWFLPASGDRVERVCLHYESVRPGHFCIHVEIDPYEKGKSIKENDPRLNTLSSELQSKAKLLEAIRAHIINDLDIRTETYASTVHLGPTDHPNTNAAVKFDKLDTNCTPEGCADFFAHVIATVTPIIDDLVAKHLSCRN